MQTIDMKVCKKCDEAKPATLEYFYRNGKSLRSDCKTCRNSYVKSWGKANPDKVYAKNKTWKNANFEKVKTANKAWGKANRDKKNVSYQIYRARKLHNGFEKYTNAEIFEAYGTNCYLCDMPINLKVSGQSGSNPQWRSGLHIEHFVANVNGGPTTLDNLRPSHAWCNLSKGIK
jgi:hypothetical protein